MTRYLSLAPCEGGAAVVRNKIIMGMFDRDR